MVLPRTEGRSILRQLEIEVLHQERCSRWSPDDQGRQDEEFLRTKRDPAIPEADPVPVVIDEGDDREQAWSDFDPVL